MVLGNIEKAIEAKFDSLKLNVVVMRNFNDDEILDFVEYTSKRDLEL
jgi:molybdenum cofactor biosynthesis enzyme MoaA